MASACARTWARLSARCTSLDSSASSGRGASLGAGAALGFSVTFNTRGGAFGLGGWTMRESQNLSGGLPSVTNLVTKTSRGTSTGGRDLTCAK